MRGADRADPRSFLTFSARWGVVSLNSDRPAAARQHMRVLERTRDVKGRAKQLGRKPVFKSGIKYPILTVVFIYL
jgi:hypothetical protein